MKKIIACKPAPEIGVEIDGGEEVLLRFDIQCLVNIQELPGGYNEFLKKNIAETAATLVYCAGKTNNADFTEEKARKMVACMTIADVTEIVNTFTESLGSAAASEEEVKKMVAQFLAK